MPDFSAEGLSLALGGLQDGVSPAKMAAAYSAIANDGVYKTPIFYTKVTDYAGNVLYEPTQEERVVMTEQNAYILKSMLTQPVISGTATYCKIPGIDVAAKTGTTNNSNDRWLCGFTNYYTAACWYGYEFATTVKGVSGNPAGNIWDAVMTAIHKDLENSKFEEPEEGIIRLTVCRTSGKLATEVCGENVYSEVFTEDNCPTEPCEGHTNTRICNDSQALATDFCPNVTESMAYLPEKERDAIWYTQNVIPTVPETTCPLHAAPPVQEPEEEEEEKPATSEPSNVNRPTTDSNDTKPSTKPNTGTNTGTKPDSGTTSGGEGNSGGTTKPDSGTTTPDGEGNTGGTTTPDSGTTTPGGEGNTGGTTTPGEGTGDTNPNPNPNPNPEPTPGGDNVSGTENLSE